MDDTPSARRTIKPDLAAALRAARADDAERSEVLYDLRSVALARLGVLRDALEPVLAQVPEECDLFDIGIMPGDPPRLFIDMIGFVEMARDRRNYRLFQDRRHGRVLLHEAATLDEAVEAVTSYMARRLVERERALASDGIASPTSVKPHSPVARTQKAVTLPKLNRNAPALYWLRQGFWFVVEVLGLLVLFGLLWLLLRWIWSAI